MKAFGVRFSIHSQRYFEALKKLFYEIKADKNSDSFRNDEEWPRFIPDELKVNFEWPSPQERQKWLEFSKDKPVRIAKPEEILCAKWSFFSVFDSLKNGEYLLLTCERTEADIGEIHIDPLAYPYGGIGPFLALVEAFQCGIIGVNEYGKYLTREDLTI